MNLLAEVEPVYLSESCFCFGVVEFRESNSMGYALSLKALF